MILAKTIKKIVFAFLITFFFLSIQTRAEERALIVNIISDDISGQKAGRIVLKEALENLGCLVHLYESNDKNLSKADINIFVEKFIKNVSYTAKYNWFIPNPEWLPEDFYPRSEIDLVLCRTKEVERIFSQFSTPTYYLGFISLDCFFPEIQKDYTSFLHLVGKSPLKGSEIVVKTWANDLTMPHLIIPHIRGTVKLRLFNYPHITWMPNGVWGSELRLLQNSCGVHLCTSITEGFGHYLVEAMSTEAVVIATDAPPMNEFIKDKRCLISVSRTYPLGLATAYEIDETDLNLKVKSLLNLAPSELEAIGKANRLEYLKRKQVFLNNLKELIEMTLKKYNSQDSISA